MLMLSTSLQLIGTILVTLFSFYGIKIDSSADTFVNNKPVTHTYIDKKWLNIARAGLTFLVLGIAVSAL